MTKQEQSTSRKPDFGLKPIETKGQQGEEVRIQIRTVEDAPFEAPHSRRGFVHSGIALGSILAGIGAQDASAQIGVDKRLVAHRGEVTSLRFIRKGRALISGGMEGFVKVWSVASLQPVHRIEFEKDGVMSMGVSKDEQEVAVGTESLIKLLDLRGSQKPRSIKAKRSNETRRTGAVAISDDELTLYSSSNSKIVVWDLRKFRVWEELEQVRSQFVDLAITSDNTRLFGCSGDRSIHCWELEPSRWDPPKAKAYVQIGGHLGSVNALILDPAQTSLISGGSDSKVLIRDLTGKVQRELGVGDDVRRLAISKDSSMLAVATDGAVEVFTYPALKKVHDFPVGGIDCLALSPNAENLAGGNEAGNIFLWNLKTGKKCSLFDVEASDAEGVAYRTLDQTTNRWVTYTLPCGSPVPAGAVCLCNCVAGKWKPPKVRSSSGGSTTTTICTCNLIFR